MEEFVSHCSYDDSLRVGNENHRRNVAILARFHRDFRFHKTVYACISSSSVVDYTFTLKYRAFFFFLRSFILNVHSFYEQQAENCFKTTTRFYERIDKKAIFRNLSV